MDNKKIMISIETVEIINNILKSFLTNYQEAIKIKTISRDFVFDYAEGLTYLSYKINLNYSGSYIDSPNYIKTKEARINLINKFDHNNNLKKIPKECQKFRLS